MSHTNARKSTAVSTRACRALQSDLAAWHEATSVFQELLRRRPWLRRQLAVRFIWDEITTLELMCAPGTAEPLRKRLLGRRAAEHPFGVRALGTGHRRHVIPGYRQVSVPVGLILGRADAVAARYRVAITFKNAAVQPGTGKAL